MVFVTYISLVPALKAAPEDERGQSKGDGRSEERNTSLGRLGGGWSTFSLCSKFGAYVINASSPGHFFQKSGPSGFYLKLSVLQHKTYNS